jgi:hypothetical protein
MVCYGSPLIWLRQLGEAVQLRQRATKRHQRSAAYNTVFILETYVRRAVDEACMNSCITRRGSSSCQCRQGCRINVGGCIYDGVHWLFRGPRGYRRSRMLGLGRCPHFRCCRTHRDLEFEYHQLSVVLQIFPEPCTIREWEHVLTTAKPTLRLPAGHAKNSSRRLRDENFQLLVGTSE